MIRVQRELEVAAQVAFDIFGEIESLPRWVPELKHAEVLTRHADGRAATVRCVALRAGVRDEYVLRYAYDRQAHSLSWAPTGETGLRGSAKFDELTAGRCRITYVLDLAMLDESVQAASGRLATGTIDAFVEFLSQRA